MMTPKIGDKRLTTKFLLIPRVIDGEWRWMRKASFEEEYQELRIMDILKGEPVVIREWKMSQWVDIKLITRLRFEALTKEDAKNPLPRPPHDWDDEPKG